MTNPFTDITNPAILRAIVQDGVKCERCKGRRQLAKQVGMTNPFAKIECPTCDGSGHIPLPNADLDALAAKWCGKSQSILTPYSGILVVDGQWYHPTTSPDAAMRLQEKYKLQTAWMEDTKEWGAIPPGHDKYSENKSLCHAITTAALIAALTEAIKGAASDD